MCNINATLATKQTLLYLKNDKKIIPNHQMQMKQGKSLICYSQLKIANFEIYLLENCREMITEAGLAM